MKASFNGVIPEIPGIAVDNFEDTTKRAYFLSHCHGDHITGLENFYYSVSSSQDSKSVFIYMSAISAAIVETFIDEKLKKYLKPLELGRTTISIPGDEDNDVEELFVSVTLIPAGHCFGSVMFLFETPLKKVLYTGDFRITENSVSKMAQLHDKDEQPIKLDVLYVDTTFQDRIYETFPKRSEIIGLVIREIKNWLSMGAEYRVALVPSARYGYEDIFNKIYSKMNLKVLTESNWDLYSKFLDKLKGVTNNKDETPIHLCSKWIKYCKTCSLNSEHKYLYIHFSAMKWGNLKEEDLAVSTSDNSRSVCFSTHCSRRELVYFVEYLAPKKVVGFLEPYLPVGEPTVVTPSKRKIIENADKIHNEGSKKVPKHILAKIFG